MNYNKAQQLYKRVIKKMLNNKNTISKWKCIVISVLCLLNYSHAQSQRYNWTKPDDLNVGLPSSVQIFTLTMDKSPFDTKLTGAFARFNMSDPNLQFIVRDTNGDALGYFPKTPQQYAAAQQNVVYAVINGGYFDMSQNISASFIAENGRVKNKNTINCDQKNHPTVGAVGFTRQQKFEIQFIYSFGDNLDTYKFSSPNIYPGPEPLKDAGVHWQVKQGLGAGPILMKDMQIYDANYQNFSPSYMINMRHPRSAICLDVVGRLYFVAIDGRYQKSDGLKMSQLADLMKNLFCLDAMNLDGGGSTMLYANSKTINRPCDAAGPRPVVSAILIRDKYKKKTNSFLRKSEI